MFLMLKEWRKPKRGRVWAIFKKKYFLFFSHLSLSLTLPFYSSHWLPKSESAETVFFTEWPTYLKKKSFENWNLNESVKLLFGWAVVVAQLVGRSLPIPITPLCTDMKQKRTGHFPIKKILQKFSINMFLSFLIGWKKWTTNQNCLLMDMA